MATAVKKQPLVELKPVNSSSLAEVGYDPATLTLGVKFKNSNTLHLYGEFSPKKFEDMRAAKSIGQFHAQHVRNQHPHSLLETDAD